MEVAVMSHTFNRYDEVARYVACYKDPAYAMGQGRQNKAREVLAELPRGRLLDVGAGRGELRDVAEPLGFSYDGIDPATGIEVSFKNPRDLAEEVYRYNKNGRVGVGLATAIPYPDKTFDTVVCLDVLEHLIPEDVEPALREMDRVSKGLLFLTAADTPSYYTEGGRDLHISARPIPEWETLFRSVYPGRNIERLGDCSPSPGWLIYPPSG
jgi:2-polyprenyl-3-methyl-5-hydroxy-6-metoxy-1,4-benzoquinol methylase